ncbi:lipoyl protein ligase domain-containing protein [Halogeometricum borinquense]|uniref:lipoyl protein ligase domain-containing protein n=1 Tax=Halogeometricum borinquense TaxID=60847 RepID=UPI00341C3800
MADERGDRTVRVVRGRAATRDGDQTVTTEMSEYVAETNNPAFRAWTPHRQMAFGRRDAHAEGYERACEAAESRGFPVVERSVGGRAVAYTGRTVAFASAVPIENDRTGLDERYETATTAVIRALRSLGVPARRGEPANSFCPGDHSVQAHGKICGIAQRVRRDVALVSGVVVVADHDAIAAVLEPVYEALDVPFDPGSVGSVARSGGPGDAERVIRALEDAFGGDAERRVTDARERVDN